jgi:hypothetical protein
MFTRRVLQMATNFSRTLSTGAERSSKLRIGFIPGTWRPLSQRKQLIMSTDRAPYRTLQHANRFRTTTLRPRCRAHTCSHRHRRSYEAPEDLRRISEARCRDWANGRLRCRPWQEPRCCARARLWPRRNIRGIAAAMGDLYRQREGGHQ